MSFGLRMACSLAKACRASLGFDQPLDWECQMVSRSLVATVLMLLFPSSSAFAAPAPTQNYDRAYEPTVPLMLRAGDPNGQSTVRLRNQSIDYYFQRGGRNWRWWPIAASVSVTAVDDGGNVYEPFTIRLGPRQHFEFNSDDLTYGNAAKGIEGLGAPLEGSWRLSIEVDEHAYLRAGLDPRLADVKVQSFVQTPDGFLAAMLDVIPDGEGRHLVAQTFNPAGDVEQQSQLLRMINYGTQDRTFHIDAWDERGHPGSVSLTLPPGRTRMLSAVDLEEGATDLDGILGDGAGQWVLQVGVEDHGLPQHDLQIAVQNLLYSSSGHISNLSASTAKVDIDLHGQDDRGYREEASELAVGGEQWGYLHPRDQDEFYIDIPPGGAGTLAIYTTGATDTVGIVESAGAADIYEGDGGEGNNFRIETRLEESNYEREVFVAVFGQEPETSGQYVIHADFTSETTPTGDGP